MKLAVSNIAWPRDHDAAVADLLRDHGVGGIEIAPTKVWPDPLAAPDAAIDAYRHFWESRGIAVVAAQALLFGKPELTLFDSPETRRRTLDYLAGIVRVCARVGAKALVFGSPKNRRVGSLEPRAAFDISTEFFRELGQIAHAAGTTVVMEANPSEYGSDFVTRAADAIDLVKAVHHPGFRLHLDTGCMTLAHDPIHKTFDAGFALTRHFHVSEPSLAAPGASGRVDHVAFAAELAVREYAGWVSLEMREPEPFTLAALDAALRRFRGGYEVDARRAAG